MTGGRIHVLGASGAGVTTLGRALADRLAVPHHDTDDYYWLATMPPYREARPVADRLRLMAELFLPRPAWVLSGSLTGWGDRLIPAFDLVVFVLTPTGVRLDRLRDREVRRYGDAAGEQARGFLDWAGQYDGGDLTMRSLATHRAWLARLPCPVVEVDGTRPLAELVDAVTAALTTAGAGSPGR